MRKSRTKKQIKRKEKNKKYIRRDLKRRRCYIKKKN